MSTLRALANARRAVTDERVIGSLDLAFARWREPGSHALAALAHTQTVYSPEVVTSGTREALGTWTADAMRGLRERELGERPPAQRIPEVTGISLAGTIPSATFAALTLPLLAGSAVYAKPASADPWSARFFVDVLREVDASVADCLGLGHDRDRVVQADAVVAYGCDATVAAIRARVPVERPFVAHGHKLSLAAIGPLADLASAARALARDVALYDGRGCLSPAFVLVDHERFSDFVDVLAREFERTRETLPIGNWAAGENAAIRDRRARAAVREDTTLRLPGDGSVAWSLFCSRGFTTDVNGGSLRSVPIVPVDGTLELAAFCASLSPHLSTLAATGWEAPAEALTRVAASGGASRVCEIGRMQAPPLDWNHDGVAPLRSLLRAVDIHK